MSTAGHIRILVVDDQPVVRFGLTAFLSSQAGMSVVAEAESGPECIELCETEELDVVIMELRLPGLSGVEAIRTIQARWPRIRSVVWTTYDGDDDIHRAFDAGARAYLIKGMPLESLADAVLKVQSGSRVVPASVAESLAGWTRNSDLTPRERDVLALLVHGKSNKMIGEELNITEGTVKCHVNVILRRLDVSRRSEAAAVALRRGIVHL